MIGKKDRTPPAILAEGRFREIWPEAPFVTLPGVGQHAQGDAPDTLLAMIEQFVHAR